MQTTLTAKQGATGRVCASRMGKEQPGNKNTDGCWQHCLLSASWDMATACTLQWTQPRQYVWWSQRWRENTLQEQSMGWLGYETIFFPRIWLEGGMAQFSLTQDCFSLVLSQHCKLQIHTLLQHSKRSSTNSFSALQFSSFSRFVQIEHYFVSKLLRVLRTSKIKRNHSEHGECLCWWELWNANQSLACGFFHCVKQRLCCCSHKAWQHSLYSAALTNAPKHLPDKCCWKESAPWKPPETPSFEFQVFKELRHPHQKKPIIFLITCHLQHSPQLLLHVHWPAARTEMSCDSTGLSWGSDTDLIGQN